MNRIFFKLFSIVFLSSSLMANQIYFMPYEQKQALHTLMDSIKSSQANIYISIFSFTNKEIAKSLKEAAKRGVKIKIIYDKEANINNPYSTIGYLSKYNGIQTCLLDGKRAKNDKYNGIMHQKMAIIDNNTILIGSANWSKNAFENNYELLLKSNDKTIISKSINYFKKMFSQCKPY
ncbi:phospholipase D-like domain-containing protein [Helicobacter sp. 13S00477-4]|uniref:phospholipase D-like domain-containing protein n=1 Tax=Helicobacter sp. 13S00477-4 TaxID=1905759 RepID=UPI000BA5E42B|nr:phospholipase D-like domain-containing protein [Helicobacter sp. 13S00477-4]PAF52166.1 nuclease NucT [Helicobacter sp. 13S00477-4]